MKQLLLAASLLTLAACSGSSPTDTRPFNRQAWVDDPELDNPYRNTYHDSRQGMVEDVMHHQLKKKMSKAEVLTLLGKPDKDGIEMRVPKDIVEPDSISIAYAKTIKDGDSKKWKKLMDDSNKFNELHARPDTLMLYIIGHEGGFGIDYNYLAVELSGKGLVKEYWVESH
jgi:hypothetical protein